jgi:hypothetical protein
VLTADKPRAPTLPPVRDPSPTRLDGDRVPTQVLPDVFAERCQAQNTLGDFGCTTKLALRTHYALALRTTARRALDRLKGGTEARVGKPSKFADGTWVRVLDADRIRATLDARGATRGLLYVEQQWPYAGRVFRVQKSLRRMLDDLGYMRPIHRTALLENVDCCGVDGTSGCGKHCPLFFRDEWLEPAEAPTSPEKPKTTGRARILSVEEIRATLDSGGRCDGLLFTEEMARHAGGTFSILKRITEVHELHRRVPTKRPFYALAGLSCSGAVLGARGPCDRGCAMLWHERWVEVGPAEFGPRDASSPARLRP